ncbi:hypothetical protein LTR66_011871 [Elasticomyces elasticus]|nr:hypothetical protein LTR66_011871 [Elasticomyces elasticus]KAK4991233.1 hypothetical protein LTR50_001991 [Elasticomyces elasticus]
MDTQATLKVLSQPLTQISLATVVLVLLLLVYFICSFTELESLRKLGTALSSYGKFAWSCFLKPHSGDASGSQQDALESFYSAQASIYDATRIRLLRGREDMLALVAAQLKHKADRGTLSSKPVWVDVGGGTGWNIEQMGQHLPVAEFFHAVYLVDLSPSLCAIARTRFQRLGWTNVKIVCQDARSFRLSDHDKDKKDGEGVFSLGPAAYEDQNVGRDTGAELITMSYSLSMIPEFHPVVDSIASLLAPNGIMGVIDFYVQNQIDFQSRNYTGGVIDRHCIWLSRVFWSGWFQLDRVSLDAARRDYLEYRLGTVLSVNARNHFLGFRIPYYIWIGCPQNRGRLTEKLAELDATVTESPFISALDLQKSTVAKGRRSSSGDRRSKAYESAVVNLAASLPLPAAWYQNHHTRIYYDDQLRKHKQFHDEYIYAFNWEDARVDARLLKINSDDVILAITSAGDNVLAYALDGPKRIHAVDLNPSQNHLLELKVAAFRALGYADVWKLFGEGKHESFRTLLVKHLSPHLSSLAFQYWMHHGPTTFSTQGRGLYYTGGSRHAIQLVQWLARILGLRKDLRCLCTVQTLNEQREIWRKRVRRVLLSQLLAYTVVGTERFLWKACGVPKEQRNMIEADHLKQTGACEPKPNAGAITSGQAIWEYIVNTLDPVVNNTLVSEDNHYYLVCLQGRYTHRCHPAYLTPRAHIKLSSPAAFDGLRIHTDELNEVISRMAPETLTIAVLMDSMDWFSPEGKEALVQVLAINRALTMGGRVLLRSAGLMPWYIQTFEAGGFAAKRVAARAPPGACIDR